MHRTVPLSPLSALLFFLFLPLALPACSLNPFKEQLEIPGQNPETLRSLEGTQLPVSKDLAARDGIHFLAFGDFGRGNEDQYRVGRAMAQVCASQGCDFAILLGDNIYGDGVESATDPQWERKFQLPYAPLGELEFWATLGNHDWHGSAQAQIDRTQQSAQWRMPAPFYAVPHLPTWLKLFTLDTDFLLREKEISSPFAQRQLSAAREALCPGPGDAAAWRLLWGHHPVRSHGGHAPVEPLRAVLGPLIRDCGVQAYFAGHDHHQELNEGDGYWQVIQGAAAKTESVREGAPAPLFASDALGFSWVSVTPISLQVRFYDVSGNLLFERSR